MKRYFVGYMLLCALMLAFVCLAVHEARGASSREYLLWQAWNSLGQKNPQDQARIRHFIDAKGKEQELLDQAKKKIAQQNALRKHLRAQFESNKNRLSMLNSELKTREGQLGLLFGYATGSAKYFNESLHNSIVSNQYPNLGIGASKLASVLPSLPPLYEMYLLPIEMLRLMVAQGQVVRYEAQVVLSDGSHINSNIVRVGPFDAIMGDLYLCYIPASSDFAVSPSQPPELYTRAAAKLYHATKGLIGFTIVSVCEAQ